MLLKFERMLDQKKITKMGDQQRKEQEQQPTIHKTTTRNVPPVQHASAVDKTTRGSHPKNAHGGGLQKRRSPKSVRKGKL
jgi:hypothetical protein